MSARSKRELLIQIAPQYREASRAQKTAILDQLRGRNGLFAQAFAAADGQSAGGSRANSAA